MGNFHVRFLEGWAPAMAPGYSTKWNHLSEKRVHPSGTVMESACKHVLSCRYTAVIIMADSGTVMNKPIPSKPAPSALRTLNSVV